MGYDGDDGALLMVVRAWVWVVRLWVLRAARVL